MKFPVYTVDIVMSIKIDKTGKRSIHRNKIRIERQ